jgi:serine/threonine-protein kinase
MDHASSTGSPPASADALPGLDLTGRTLGDYRVLRRLGAGGMGQVYLAEQVSLKRKVALKILRPDLAADPSSLQRFKLEAESVARATHANIVQVYATGEADGLPYMALEYVEGRNLREYVTRRGPPDVLIGLSIMRQVASALQRAGELGIVHRDIKPENILVTRKGEVKVADFGLSRCLAGDRPPPHLTQSGTTMGTPLYMAPEQVEGRPVDPRTDIYAFGVTCYYLFAGQPPFRGETAFEVALQHVRAEPAPLAAVRPDLPEALCAVVHKMMAKDPGQRYQTGRELLKDVVRLRESLGGQTGAVLAPTVPVEAVPAATPPPAATPAGVPPRRRGRLPGLIALSLVLALTAGALLAWYRRQATAPSYAPVVPPGDVSEAEEILKREQKLREEIEPYLNAPRDVEDLVTGFKLCLKLGLYYLEAGRLDDAEQLFTRLDHPFHNVRPYHTLGRLGRGIVLALRNRARESNQMFREALTGPQHDRLPPRRFKGAAFPLWVNPQWCYQVTQALYYNACNGVKDEDVPPPFRKFLPPHP